VRCLNFDVRMIDGIFAFGNMSPFADMLEAFGETLAPVLQGDA
jgi:hypothetical protein